MFTVVVGCCWFLVVCGSWLNVFTYKLRFKLKSCDEGWTSWWLAAGGSKCVVTQWSRREPKGSDFWMRQANIRHMSNMSLLVAMSSVSLWHSWVHLKNTSSQILQVLLPQNICYFQWCDLTIWWGLSWYTCAMFIYIYIYISKYTHASTSWWRFDDLLRSFVSIVVSPTKWGNHEPKNPQEFEI